MDHGTFNLAWF